MEMTQFDCERKCRSWLPYYREHLPSLPFQRFFLFRLERYAYIYMLYLPIPAISYMAAVCEKDVVFRVCTCSALYYHTAGVVGMAEQALGALKRMKAGLNAENSRDKKGKC